MTVTATLPAPYTVMRRAVILIAVVATAMAFIENSGFWYWNVSDSAALVNNRPFSGPFRQLLRLALLLSFLGAFGLGRFDLIKRVLITLAPLLPFFLFGLLAMVWSISKAESAKVLFNWSLVFFALAAASAQLSPDRLRRVLVTLFVGGVGASFLAYLLLPDIATDYHFGDPVMRGFFGHKNTFGYFSALGGIVLVALNRYKTLRGLAMLALLWAGVVGSGSAAALAVGVTGTIYVLALRSVVPYPQFHLPFVVLLLALLIVSTLTVIFALEWATGLLGRSATLSGRTLLWEGYLNYFGDRIALGQGAGLFSTLKERGRDITGALAGGGDVGLPHNLYIALLGEVGVVGVILFVGGHLWIMLVSPFRNRSEWAVLASALSFVLLLRAMAEDGDGYNVSVAFILIVLARGQNASRAGKLLPKNVKRRPWAASHS